MNQQIRSFNRDFDAIVNIYGERPALIPAFEGQKAINYEQLSNLAFKYLAWLRELGLKRGDRIGALMPNSLELLTLFIACMRGGFVFAPLACDTAAVEAENWVKLIRPVRIIVSTILPDPVRTGLRASDANCVEVTTGGNFEYLPSNAAAVECADGAKICLFTSGTTGQPKAIVIDGDRLWSAGHAFLRNYGINFDVHFRIWNYLPQSYLGGLFNLCLIPMTVAGSVVVDEAFSGKSFLSYWQTIDRYDITALWLVPTIVRGLLAVGERTRRYETKSYRDAIKIALLGTAPIELSTKTRFEEVFGITLLENYALSETTFLTAEMPQDIATRSEGSVGSPLPYVEMQFKPVSGDTDTAYQQILVRTPFLFDGYMGVDGKISTELIDGFFATGDLGYLDTKGQLIVTGRCKEIIKKGGQFVSLREIEIVAMGHPLVANAAAAVVAHPFYGESYKLLVQLLPSASSAALDDVRNHLYENIAKYKWPERIEVVDELPLTSSGKVRKFLLKSKGDL